MSDAVPASRGWRGVVARLRAAVALTRRELRLLAPIVLAVRVPAALAGTILGEHVLPAESTWVIAVPLWIDAVTWPIAAAAVLHALARRDEGEAVRPGAALRLGWRDAGRLFKAQLIATILQLLGLVALVIPGLVLLVRWALLDQAVVLEGVGARTGRARSAQLVHGRFAQVAAMAVACLAWVGLVEGVLYLPTALVPALDAAPVTVAIDALTAVVAVPVQVAFYLLWRERVDAVRRRA